MKKSLFVLLAAIFVLGLGVAVAGNPDCPDADGDGICNGQDPDYVPGTCTADCPDADGDGICNCQDPDYSRPGGRHPNLTCPDADRDGICNGQDPDYVPSIGLGGRLGRIVGIMFGGVAR